VDYRRPRQPAQLPSCPCVSPLRRALASRSRVGADPVWIDAHAWRRTEAAVV